LLEQDYCEVPGEFSVSQGERILYPQEHEFASEGVPQTVRRAHQDAARSYAAGLYEPSVFANIKVDRVSGFR